VSEDVYECSYTPHDADALMVSVLYAGQPVAQSPYPVSVGPVSKCAMKAYGAGLVDGVAGFPATFTVQTNDEPGALGTLHCLSLSFQARFGLDIIVIYYLCNS